MSNFLTQIYLDIRSCKFVDTNIFGHLFVSKFWRMSHSDRNLADFPKVYFFKKCYFLTDVPFDLPFRCLDCVSLCIFGINISPVVRFLLCDTVFLPPTPAWLHEYCNVCAHLIPPSWHKKMCTAKQFTNWQNVNKEYRKCSFVTFPYRRPTY